MPHHRRPDEHAQASTLAWAREKAHVWLKILDDSLRGRDWLVGDDATIADYFGASRRGRWSAARGAA
jgi:glutathione S-transferase